MGIKEKKILMVIAHTNFRDEEYEIPRKIFEEAGAKIVVASTSLEPAKGSLGMLVNPDILLSNAESSDYDAIVFVGGPGTVGYFQDNSVIHLVKRANEERKIIAAICIAPVILANAGILVDKNATADPSESERLETEGAFYTGRIVERDGDIITASGPRASEEFAKAIVKALGWLTDYKKFENNLRQ